VPSTRVEWVVFAVGLCAIGVIGGAALSLNKDDPKQIAVIGSIAGTSKELQKTQPSTGSVIAKTTHVVPSTVTGSSTNTFEAGGGGTPVIRKTRLRLTATRGSCWVMVRQTSATGQVIFEGVLAEGESRGFTGAEFWLRLGAAANVDATINGRPLKGLPQGTASLQISRTGLSSVGP
jgi:uncharacterized protein DUF4115